MALIKCYECGAEISDAAKSCHHCGAPTTASAIADGTVHGEYSSRTSKAQEGEGLEVLS